MASMKHFRNLSLFWKLLVPFLALMLIAGVLGAFLIVRDLSSRAETALNEDLSRRSLEARSLLHDRELYLLESVNFAANVEGMTAAIRRGETRDATRLLQSVLALKTDLTLLAVTDDRGIGVRAFFRTAPRSVPTVDQGRDWGVHAFVRRVLTSDAGAKFSGFIRSNDRVTLAIAAPICAGVTRCRPVGAAIAGIAVDALARGAALGDRAGQRAAQSDVAIYGRDGTLLASHGSAPSGPPPAASVAAPTVRRTWRAGEREMATLYAPFEVQGRPVGRLAVTVPTAPAFSTARGAGVRLALILLAAMAGVMAIGAFLSRTILHQVRPLVETNRALGTGDLSARAPVFGSDELGELAHGVNQMAEQLQASYETLEMRVAQRTEEVQRLLRERTEFFAAMSHELRTPLAVVLGQTDMLLDPSYPQDRGWIAETSRTIKQSAGQLLGVVNDILNLAKAEGGDLEVNLETLRLPEVVQEMRGTFEGLARAGGLQSTIDIPATLPDVEADRQRLGEILLNLWDNAVKYTPNGGQVRLAAEADGGMVAVSVSDTGIGIPDQARERIFEPFYRVKGSRTQRGQASTGLGLALTKRLVEAQGGEIDVVSEPGAGTTFTFTLRAARRAISVSSVTRANGSGTASQPAMVSFTRSSHGGL